jgi:hypothetical protein
MVDCTYTNLLWRNAWAQKRRVFHYVEQTLGPMPSQEWQEFALAHGLGYNTNVAWLDFPQFLVSRSDACLTALEHLRFIIDNFTTDMPEVVELMASERRVRPTAIQSFNVGHGGSTFHHVYLPALQDYMVGGTGESQPDGFLLPLVWLQGDMAVLECNEPPFVNNWEQGVLGQEIWVDAAPGNQWAPDDPGRWVLWASAVYMYMMFLVKMPEPDAVCNLSGILDVESLPWVTNLEGSSCGNLNLWQTRSGYFLRWDHELDSSDVETYCNAGEGVGGGFPGAGPNFCGAEHCGTNCPDEFACENACGL